MKKITALLISAVLALGILAACGEGKLKVSAPAEYFAEAGTNFTVPQPQIFSMASYNTSISVTGEDGGSVILDDKNTFYISKYQDYTISYTVTSGTQTASCTSVLKPTDAEKPFFRKDLKEFRVLRGETVRVPDLGITDNGGPITPKAEVTDNDGNVVTLDTDNSFTVSDSASAYNISVTATDRAGNSAVRELTAYVRSAADEVEFFEDEYYFNTIQSADLQTISLSSDVTAAEDSRSSLKWQVPSACWWPSVKLTKLGVSDWREAKSLSLWVYNDSDITDFEWHGIAINGAWDSLQYFNRLPSRAWKEVVIPMSAIEGNLISDIANVRDLTFTFDNSPDGLKNTDINFYIDNVRLNFPPENWVPEVVENDEITVIELNNFEDKPHLNAINGTGATDLSRTTFELSTAHVRDFAGKTASQSALKMTMKHAANNYPRFTMKIDKTLAAAGAKLSELPDNASFQWDMFFGSESERDRYEGMPYVFYLKDDNTEQKPAGVDMGVNKGNWQTSKLTIGDIRSYCAVKKIDIDTIESVGLFFYCTVDWEGNGPTVFYIDNARLEIPKYDLNWVPAADKTLEDGTVVREINSFNDLGRFKSVAFGKGLESSSATLEYLKDTVIGEEDFRAGLAVMDVRRGDGYVQLEYWAKSNRMELLGDWSAMTDDTRICIDVYLDSDEAFGIYPKFFFRKPDVGFNIDNDVTWAPARKWHTVSFTIGEIKAALKKKGVTDEQISEVLKNGNLNGMIYYVDASEEDWGQVEKAKVYFDDWRIEIPKNGI